MSVFVNYCRNKPLTRNSEQLDIIRNEEGCKIFAGQSPVLTPGGKEFVHKSDRVVQLIATDLMFPVGAAGEGISAPCLYSFQQDVFEPEGDPFLVEWETMVATDPFVTLKATGNFYFQSFNPEERLFSFAFITLASLTGSVNEFVSSSMSKFILQESESPPILELLRLSYSRLSPEKKVVLQALSGFHHAGIVLPLVLISGFISPMEYTKGLIALKILQENRRNKVLLDITRALDYLECMEQDGDAANQVGHIIGTGENDSVEFKSTLRWDIRAGKTSPAVERASLKTVAAFLNSSGGRLLIGVRDDGSIEGIESDRFTNDDKFLLHLWTLIRTCLGRDVSPYIRSRLEKIGDKTVCMVQCLPCNRPVFLRQPGFDEAFYMRLGPSSNAMDISEALKYIADRFESLHT